MNSVGQTMLLIPPGEFLMGSTDEQVEAALTDSERTGTDQPMKDRLRNNERPQHKVIITKPFLLSATEVTIGQFKKFAAATGYLTEGEKAEIASKPAGNLPPANPIFTYLKPGYSVIDDLPASVLTWNDATSYCNWLSKVEQSAYRLPTEAEWEYACRAGTSTQFSFGDDADLLNGHCWFHKNAEGKPHQVGMKQPIGFNLFDMHGNLYEWCQDYFADKQYSATTLIDPVGPTTGGDRVVRGGSWRNFPSYCRSATRSGSTPSPRNPTLGFRIVREFPAPSTTASVTPQLAVPAASPGKLFMHDPAFPQWVKDVQAMPAERQIEAVSKKLMELNPGFDGKLTGTNANESSKIESGVVTTFSFIADKVNDISPLRALAGLKELRCFGTAFGKSELFDITPLHGMSLTSLTLSRTKVSDLSPLKELPLTHLSIQETPISDLTPLGKMPLVVLNCKLTLVADLSPLTTCNSLAGLDVAATKVPPAQVIALQKALPNCKIEWNDPAKPTTPQPASTSKLFMHDPAFPQWLKDVQAMPAEKQIEAVRKKLVELNPRFNGILQGANTSSPTIENNTVTKVTCFTDEIADISPLRAFAELKLLKCSGNARRGKLVDLSPLAGVRLAKLDIHNNAVEDLSSLRSVPLIELQCERTMVSDLSPLINNSKLEKLDVRSTQVTPATVAALEKALPNCKIEWDDPTKAKTPQPAASGTK